MSKKNAEKLYLEWFMEKAKWGNCIIHEDEEPDFKIEFPDKVIGLEVTNLYKDEKRKGSPYKQKESTNIKWLNQVADIYYQNTNIPIRVQVLHGSKDIPCKPENLADRLLKKLPTGNLQRIKFEQKCYPGGKMKVDILRLPDDFGNYKRWTFVNNHVGWSRDITPDILYNKINNKIKKLHRYKQKHNEVVLLIVVDPGFDSGMFHLSGKDFDFSNSGFDAIYLEIFLQQYIKIG